jgi:transcriptional regulator with XRE-family HTH domain
MSYKPSETEFLKKLGLRIRTIREEKGFSQEKLSFECGLHRTYISSVERGKRNIAVINLRKIADALGIPITHFFVDLNNLDDLYE